ncbi:MAG: hypothetical protein KDA96_22735, partial [Planctomycetaceae bacterium]|nr:hypothetical protein [Planctomycetaceae bacterium]
MDRFPIARAADVWVEMIAAARSTLDIGQFYIANQPGHRMEPVLDAVVAAGQRGVRVRVLVDGKFFKTYGDDARRLGAHPGIELLPIDFEQLSRGVLHAK